MAGLADPEELGFLGVWGLMQESVKVFRSHTKIFLALMLTLTLPLCTVGLGHTLITEPIMTRVSWDEFQLSFGLPDTRREQKIDQDLHRELSKLLVVLVVYLLALFAFSLLSTSAIIYSVACIYSERITSYKKVLSVVPRVWNRLMITFTWALLLMFVYAFLWMVAIFTVATIFAFISQGSDLVISVVVWGAVIVFFVGVVYFSCIWHLASVVTVLEDSYGIRAMRKSLTLIKGKQVVAFCLFLMYAVMAFLISLAFSQWVVHGSMHGVPSVAWRTVFGCALILILSFLDLLGFLLQTVFYFACKAHHHQSIDRLQLSELLGSYLGEYIPLRGSIQLEPLDV